MKQNSNIEALQFPECPRAAFSFELFLLSWAGAAAGSRNAIGRRRRDGRAISFVFVALSADFDQLKPTFDRMLSSIRFQPAAELTMRWARTSAQKSLIYRSHR